MTSRLKKTSPPSRAPRPGISAITAALALLLCLSSASSAAAFSLFGIHLFGPRAETAAVDMQNPTRYSVAFSITGGNAELEKFLRNRSQLIADQSDPVDGDLGVVVKARDDLPILVGALYEMAYYGGLVNISIAGQPIADIAGVPDFGNSGTVPVTIQIMAGPRFSFANVTLDDAASQFKADALGLKRGEPANSTLILQAASTISNTLHKQGHPFAEITKRDVIADHANSTIDVTIAATAGPKANLGPIAIDGKSAVDPDFIRTYSKLKAGEPYSPETLTKAANRLRSLKTFSSVNIATADALDANGQLPTTVHVKDGKFRYYGLGGQVSSIDGLGLSGYWGHRNLFGHAEGLKLEASVSRIGAASSFSDLDLETGLVFTRPGAFSPDGTLSASIKTGTDNPDPYSAFYTTADLTYALKLTEANTVTASADTTFSNIEDAFGTNNYLTFSTPVSFDRDSRNDALNPTSGVYFLSSVEPGYDFLNDTLYGSLNAVGSSYLSLDDNDRFVLAGRLGAGSIFGGDSLKDIAATSRFYSGGGGTVRGYAYKSISPRNSAGQETGGRSYVMANVEARVGITDSIQLVPFFDATDVSDKQFPDFSDIRSSAGIGLRYLTGFGPLRLDIALPLDRYSGGDSYGIYAGIGQSF